MSVGATVTSLEVQAWSDEEIVARVVAGEAALFEVLMRRHNQRIYRIVRSILDDDGEAEDVMQDAYVRAYQHLGQFESRSTFVTWLTRIATWPAEPPLGRPDDLSAEGFAAHQRHELMTTAEGSRLLLKQGHLVLPRSKNPETEPTV